MINSTVDTDEQMSVSIDAFLRFCNKEIKSNKKYGDDWEIISVNHKNPTLLQYSEEEWDFIGGSDFTWSIVVDIIIKVKSEKNIDRIIFEKNVV